MAESDLEVVGGKAYAVFFTEILRFNVFQKWANRSIHYFLEPVNFELMLAVVLNFLPSFGCFSSIAKAKKRAFFDLNHCQKVSQLLAQSNSTLQYNIVSEWLQILLANTIKWLKVLSFWIRTNFSFSYRFENYFLLFVGNLFLLLRLALFWFFVNFEQKWASRSYKIVIKKRVSNNFCQL